MNIHTCHCDQQTGCGSTMCVCVYVSAHIRTGLESVVEGVCVWVCGNGGGIVCIYDPQTAAVWQTAANTQTEKGGAGGVKVYCILTCASTHRYTQTVKVCVLEPRPSVWSHLASVKPACPSTNAPKTRLSLRSDSGYCLKQGRRMIVSV